MTTLRPQRQDKKGEKVRTHTLFSTVLTFANIYSVFFFPSHSRNCSFSPLLRSSFTFGLSFSYSLSLLTHSFPPLSSLPLLSPPLLSHPLSSPPLLSHPLLSSLIPSSPLSSSLIPSPPLSSPPLLSPPLLSALYILGTEYCKAGSPVNVGLKDLLERVGLQSGLFGGSASTAHVSAPSGGCADTPGGTDAGVSIRLSHTVLL